MSPARFLLLVPLLVVAIVSFVFVRVNQGNGGLLVADQRHAQMLTPAGVARVVKAAPDPIGGRPGISASCTPLGDVELRNPWRCEISYASGRRIAYLVQIHADGSYSGDHEVVHFHGGTHPDTGQITGCCIVIP
jgi:hypothetical protein